MPYAKHYQSTFRAPEYCSSFASAAALTFDSYSFKRTFCTVDLHGKIMLVERSEPKMILVAKGWQKFVQASVLTEGYLSKGYSKYAFWVHFLSILTYSRILSSITCSSYNRVLSDQHTMQYSMQDHLGSVNLQKLKMQMTSLRSSKSCQ